MGIVLVLVIMFLPGGFMGVFDKLANKLKARTSKREEEKTT